MSDPVMPTPPSDLTSEQLRLLERLSDRVVKLRFTLPAVMFLESVRPLNFIGSQVMLFFAPVIHAVFTTRDYDLLQQALERRETIGYFVDLLEAKEQVAHDRERSERRIRKASRARKGR